MMEGATSILFKAIFVELIACSDEEFRRAIADEELVGAMEAWADRPVAPAGYTIKSYIDYAYLLCGLADVLVTKSSKVLPYATIHRIKKQWNSDKYEILRI